MRLWDPHPRTGRYPVLRILWNILWLVPLQAIRVLFCLCVFCTSGPTNAGRVWDATR